MPITPDQYSSISVYELLQAAARGHIGVDHRLLHLILDDPAAAMPDLVRFAAEDHDDDRINLDEDLVLITAHLHAPDLLPFLIEQVRLFPDDVPDHLVETICGFREQALEPLLDLHRKLGSEAGSEVPFLLASLGVKDERIEDILQELSGADSEEALFCLEIYKEVGKGTGEAEPFDIWEEYPEVADPPFEFLPDEDRLEFLHCDAPELREAAAASFSNEEDLSTEILQQLIAVAKDDPEPRVRGAAWRALALEEDNETLHRLMMGRLLDDTTPPPERAGLAIALSAEAGEQEVRNIIISLFEEENTRAAALEAMWRSMDRTYTTYVKRGLDDPDIETREQALMGVGYLGISGELGRVKEMFDDPSLRPSALLAYALAIPSEISPGRMKGLFRRIEDAAGSLDPDEAEIVKLALDNRLQAAGKKPMFSVE